MLRRVVLVRTDSSEEHIASIRVKRMVEVGTLLAISSNYVVLRSVLQLLITANVVLSLLDFVTLMMEAIRSSEASVLTRATWCHVPEDGILHKTSYIYIYIYIELFKVPLTFY
jgi:hypothetical protein